MAQTCPALKNFYDAAKKELGKTRRVDLVAFEEEIREREKSGETRRNAILNAAAKYEYLETMREEMDAAEAAFEYEQAEGVKLEESEDFVKIGRAKRAYIDNIRWALKAAGQYDFTQKYPKKCPNAEAWYLFKRAIDDPKSFTSIMNQAEGKQKEDRNEERDNIIKDSEISIKQINRLLEEIKTTR